MSESRHPLFIPGLLAAALLMVLSVPAHADQKQRAREARAEKAGEPRDSERAARQRRQDTDTLSDSVRRIERATQGQVLSAERMVSDGRNVNRIKVVDDTGRVRVYMDDPQQRAGSSTRGDDD